MRALVIAPQPFYSSRGTPLSVYYRALVMAEQGVEIDLLTYGSGKDVRISGVRVIRMPRLDFLEPLRVGPSWSKLLLDAIMVVWTFNLLLRRRYEVIHAHEESVFWARFLKPLFGFRLIYDMHSSLPQQLTNFRFTTSKILIGAFRALERASINGADAVITICPDLRDYAITLHAKPDRVLLIENSVTDDVQLVGDGAGETPESEYELIVPDAGCPTICYAGTFEIYQGVEVLLYAFAKVLVARPDARLMLIGGTTKQVSQMSRLASSLGVAPYCTLTGHVPRDVAKRYLRAAQVLVSMRLHGSNTPLKVYEMLGSGKAIVATRVWAHTQVLDDSICFLSEPDPASLADNLLRALSDDDEVARRVSNARARFERDYARPVYEAKIRQLIDLVS